MAGKTFIQRDYTEGTAVKFQEKLPDELVGKVDPSVFVNTIHHINEIFGEAEKLGFKTYAEGCLGCLTAYLIFLCMESNYDKQLKRLDKFLDDVNATTFHPLGLHIVNPLERGFRVIEIQIGPGAATMRSP